MKSKMEIYKELMATLAELQHEVNDNESLKQYLINKLDVLYWVLGDDAEKLIDEELMSQLEEFITI